ncbi:MAG: hypothetical protein AAF657_18690 [Acidobacteriota bacterium]
MDENRPAYSLHAPATSSAARAMRLPARREGWPRVDDHLVEPETSRDEMIGGVRYEASPSDGPHGIQNGELDYVVRAHVASGYKVATDLLTRFDEDSDFASDTAVLKDGIDPDSGTRYLEEIAFEVVSQQNEAKIRRKVPRMLRRGVRRVFAVFVKKNLACEWSAERARFEPLDRQALIEDPCLGQPLEVEALLDAAVADDAVFRALVAKGNPAARKLQDEAVAETKTEAVLTVLEARGLEVTETTRERLLATTDLELLDRWLVQAVTAASAEDLIATDSA